MKRQPFTRRVVLPETKPEGRMETAKKLERVPLGHVNKFEFEDLDKENFFYYVVNAARKGQVQRFLRAGFEFVTDDGSAYKEGVADVTQMDTRVTRDMGFGDVGYLMRQPMRFHKEDKELKRQQIDNIEKQMRPDKSKNQYGRGLYSDKE
jgi:hypothetical protein